MTTHDYRPHDGPRYDYDRQAWIVDGRYVRCGHPEAMDCRCYGRLHAGEVAPAQQAVITDADQTAKWSATPTVEERS